MNQYPSPSPVWPVHHFRAMGCQMAVWLDLPTDQAKPLFQLVEQKFAVAEQCLSRFRPDSELMRLNQQTEQWVTVSAQLGAVLQEALALASATNGLFDPTLLTSLQALGYTRSFEQLGEMAGGGSAGGGHWADVKWRAEQQAVWLPAGVQFDLGGIAKGYTAQQLVNELSWYAPVLIDAGGDITAGFAPAGWPGWPVGLTAPWHGVDDQKNLCSIWLTQATLATSGIDYRRWTHNGRVVHHILDPRTGLEAQTNLLTATVLAPDASQAEAWATATMVAGCTAGFNQLAEQNLAALLIDNQEHLWLTNSMLDQAIWPLESATY